MTVVRGFEVLSSDDSTFNVFPKRATKQSAGYDLYANHDVVLYPGERRLVKTGVTAFMPSNEFLMITPRSGLALKYGLTVLNSPGIVDADYYPNEIGVILHNTSGDTFACKRGERIAQSVFTKYLTDNNVVDKEREGGFGSTDELQK